MFTAGRRTKITDRLHPPPAYVLNISKKSKVTALLISGVSAWRQVFFNLLLMAVLLLADDAAGWGSPVIATTLRSGSIELALGYNDAGMQFDLSLVVFHPSSTITAGPARRARVSYHRALCHVLPAEHGAVRRRLE